MSAIFLSYKREDELRVGRLVHALENAGLSVWWDRGLAVGENWRAEIQTALQSAKCVIVVWTQASVGPTGDFVRDEAGQAKRRGILVPILLDKVEPPLGFGEIQAIDLARWKGRARDPFFGDLVAAVNARLEGRPIPPAKGPMRRVMRRLTYGSVGSAIVSGVVAFGSNMAQVQDRTCRVPLFQPRISDACGAIGIGDRPGKIERIAWESRQLGSCAALRAHIERFPDGKYRTDASAMLAARRVTETESWVPASRRLALFVEPDNVAVRNEAGARTAALARAQAPAERLCKGFAATTLFRLRTTTPIAQTWSCRAVTLGVTCSFEGEAVCEVDERHVQEEERCGS